jgi:hypothetical protein
MKQIKLLEPYKNQTITDSIEQLKDASCLYMHNTTHIHYDGNDIFASAVGKHDADAKRYCTIRVRIGNSAHFDVESYFPGPVFLGSPKLVRLGDGVYLTFNTNGKIDASRRPHIMKIYPEIEPPTAIVYDKSAPSEKNWILFEHENEVYCLYSLSPLKILKRVDSSSWRFEDHYVEATGFNNKFHNGSTMFTKDGYLYGFGHMIVNGRAGRRSYFANIYRLDMKSNTVEVSRDQCWAYDMNALSGAYNASHIISTLFFGSAELKDDKVRVAVGVNDSLSAIADIPLNHILDGVEFGKIPYEPPPEEPTKTQQAKNATKAIASAAKSIVKTQVLRKGRVSDDLYKKRLNTCTNCPGNHAVFKNGALHTCGQFKDSITGKLPTCGCVLTKKARDESQNCPMGYWANLTIEGK